MIFGFLVGELATDNTPANFTYYRMFTCIVACYSTCGCAFEAPFGIGAAGAAALTTTGAVTAVGATAC